MPLQILNFWTTPQFEFGFVHLFSTNYLRNIIDTCRAIIPKRYHIERSRDARGEEREP